MQHSGENEIIRIDLPAGALTKALGLPVATSQDAEPIRAQGLEVRRVVRDRPLQGVQLIGVHRLPR